MTTRDDYVTRGEFAAYCRQERKKHFDKWAEHDRQAREKFNRKMKRLLNPPPAPKPKPPEDPEPEITDVKYADCLYSQGGGLMQTEIDRGQQIHEDLTFWDDD